MTNIASSFCKLSILLYHGNFSSHTLFHRINLIHHYLATAATTTPTPFSCINFNQANCPTPQCEWIGKNVRECRDAAGNPPPTTSEYHVLASSFFKLAIWLYHGNFSSHTLLHRFDLFHYLATAATTTTTQAPPTTVTTSKLQINCIAK